MTGDPDKAAKLKELLDSAWREYRSDIEDRLQAVQQGVDLARRGQLSQDHRAQANSAAHKLAGVLGTFGMRDSSRAALEIERLLADGASLAEEQVGRLESLMALIAEAVAARDKESAG